jgi:paraquat-inducible protein B
MCSVGERIQLAELESLVLASASLTTLLTSLIEVIYNGNARNSVRENLSKLLEHLAKDGYVMLADKSSGTYQITGKIEQLYTAMRFLDDNQAIDQAEVDDQLDLLDAKSADQVQQADQDDSVGAKAGNIDRDEDGSEVG